VSDYQKAAGWEVFHIMAKDKQQEHPYTKADTIVEGELNYKAII
jgi:hypothetical protein